MATPLGFRTVFNANGAGSHSLGLRRSRYPRAGAATLGYEMATPLGLPEWDFNANGVGSHSLGLRRSRYPRAGAATLGYVMEPLRGKGTDGRFDRIGFQRQRRWIA